MSVAVCCRIFSPISGQLLDFDAEAKQMVDHEYNYTRDLQRAHACVHASRAALMFVVLRTDLRR